MLSLLSFHKERVAPESYRVAESCAAILSALERRGFETPGEARAPPEMRQKWLARQ
jgi:hypothetical protein